MKRYELNRYIAEASAFFAEKHFVLPPFADWTPNEWNQRGTEANELRTQRLGWDITPGVDNKAIALKKYPIPAGTIANEPNASYKADRIERTVSTTNQPQHIVVTSTWDWPLGKTPLAQDAVERANLGGFKFSGIYQAYSGSPLAVTASTCQTNPASSTCEPTPNPNFSGSARQNGKWGHGATWANYNTTSYIVPSVGSTTTAATAPFIAPNLPSGQTSLLNTSVAPAYTFGNAPRTTPYNLRGLGNYELDLAMIRSFPLHITESTKFDFRAEWYNVTNHTLFSVASTSVGNSAFGQVTSSGSANHKVAQFTARIEFLSNFDTALSILDIERIGWRVATGTDGECGSSPALTANPIDQGKARNQ